MLIKYLSIIFGVFLVVNFLFLCSTSFWVMILLIIFLLLGAFFFKATRNDKLTYVILSILSRIFIIFSMALLLRIFVFEIVHIPSSSMLPTLLPGDIVLVNKMRYGPRLPRNLNDVPWLNFFTSKKLKQEKTTYNRLKGLKNVRKNDVVIFNRSNQNDLLYTKRCAGLPGDTLFSYSKELNVDKRIYTPFQENDFSSKQKKFYTKVSSLKGENPYFIIPYKGMIIRITELNLELYGPIIEKYDSKSLNFTLENAPKDSFYTFNLDYYYMLGDNRVNSIDSRFWGVIPKNQINGKASIIIFSKKNQDRLFRKIN